MMTTRVFRTMTNGAHVENGVPGLSKTMTGIPSHLGYMVGKPAAASTPPRGVLLPRIPPSSRANMGRLANGGTHATYRYEHPEGSRQLTGHDELQHICMQGKGNDEGEARATTSGTRKRGAHNKVSAEPEATQAPVNKGQVEDEMERRARVTAAKVRKRAANVRKLKDLLRGEQVEADTAWERAFVAEVKADESHATFQRARDATKALFAAGDDLLARGCELTMQMEIREWDSQEMEAHARKNANASSELAKEARRVAKQHDGEVAHTESILQKVEAHYASAQRVAAQYEQKPSRNGDRVAEGVSSCGDDQEGPKTKKARR